MTQTTTIECVLVGKGDEFYVRAKDLEAGDLIGQMGPFDTLGEANNALQDLLQLMRSIGAVDIPARPQ